MTRMEGEGRARGGGRGAGRADRRGPKMDRGGEPAGLLRGEVTRKASEAGDKRLKMKGRED